MKNTIKRIMLVLLFTTLWQTLSLNAAILVTLLFLWAFFNLDHAMLGYLGFLFILGGITANSLGALAPSERLLTYGLFFVFALILLNVINMRKGINAALG